MLKLILGHRVGGEYELGKTIGKGHFSKVKLAENVKTHELFACKVMERKALAEEHMEDQLKREIAIMRKLDHPNVTKLYEVYQTGKHVYLIMELVTGGELFDQIVKSKRFTEDVSRTYFQQLIRGISYCHLHGIAHRDLKPENLLLDANGTLKISDFGLSNTQSTGALLSTMCGTPEYVAPEVIAGHGYNGFIADIWSCGCILYVMMAGSLPFKDTKGSSMFSNIKEGRFEIKAHFSEGVTDLIKHLLVPDPKKRYTVDEIVAHEWFRVGFDIASWTAMRSQQPITADTDAIRSAVKHVEEDDGDSIPGAPVARDVSSYEMVDSLTRHPNYADPSFVENKYNTRFGVKGTPVEVVKLLVDTLEGMNAHPQVKEYYTIKGCVDVPGGVLTYIFSVGQSQDSNSVSIVQVRKNRGSTMQFHDFYHRLLESLREHVSE